MKMMVKNCIEIDEKVKLDDELNLALNYILKLDKGLNLPPAILKIASDKISALKILLANYYNDHSFKLLLDTYFTNNLNVLLSATFVIAWVIILSLVTFSRIESVPSPVILL